MGVRHALLKQVRLVGLELTKSSGRRLNGFYPPAILVSLHQDHSRQVRRVIDYLLKDSFLSSQVYYSSLQLMEVNDNELQACPS